MNVGDAVLVWIGSVAQPGESIPIGGKVISDIYQSALMVWLDTCQMGTHLPQMYRLEEVEPLDADTARAHGLCGDCLGYGTTAEIDVARMPTVDLLDEPCPTCTGTGRPHLRMDVQRHAGDVTVRMSSVAHEPVCLPGRPDICMACGMPPPEHAVAPA